MSRAWAQFVVGVGLGILSIVSSKQPNGDGESLAIALVVAGAGATVVLPRLWWTGFLALWLGQGVAHATATGDPRQTIDALRASVAATAAAYLVGAVLGGALWSVVARRHDRSCGLGDVDRPDGAGFTL